MRVCMFAHLGPHVFVGYVHEYQMCVRVRHRAAGTTTVPMDTCRTRRRSKNANALRRSIAPDDRTDVARAFTSCCTLRSTRVVSARRSEALTPGTAVDRPVAPSAASARLVALVRASLTLSRATASRSSKLVRVPSRRVGGGEREPGDRLRLGRSRGVRSLMKSTKPGNPSSGASRYNR